jgi:hypothetical protein
MFFSYTFGFQGYDMYEATSTFSSKPFGRSRVPMFFMGWNLETGQLVAKRTWFGATYLGLFDPISKNISRPRPYFQYLQARKLSPDGNWVAYLGRFQNFFGPPDGLNVINMTEDLHTTLIQVKSGEGLSTPVWSPGLDQSTLAVLSGPVVDGDDLRPIRLLITSPDRPGDHTVVAEAAPGEAFAMPVFCPDGALLYRVEQSGQYHLRRQMPNHPPETLLTLDHPFQPLACS